MAEMTADKLDEQALRRPEFDAARSTPVMLADGQEWHLRRPYVRFVPADSEVGFEVYLTLGDGFGRILQDANTTEGSTLVKAEMAAAKALLQANYTLTMGQVGELVQFGYDAETDPEGAARREAVLGVVTGRTGPKPSGAGDA